MSKCLRGAAVESEAGVGGGQRESQVPGTLEVVCRLGTQATTEDHGARAFVLHADVLLPGAPLSAILHSCGPGVRSPWVHREAMGRTPHHRLQGESLSVHGAVQSVVLPLWELLQALAQWSPKLGGCLLEAAYEAHRRHRFSLLFSSG